MALISMDDIKAKLLAKDKKFDSSSKKGFGDNAIYPFWNVPEGSQAVLRFLPDGDPNNDFFWVERLVINLPFQGIVGGDNREVKVTVPCMEMYGETCPILAETRPWWKDPDLAEIARVYWKKKSYIFQGFVASSPFKEDNTPENPIRRFAINPSIFEIIKSSLMNAEIEDLPTDYELGRDFKLVKTKKGEYANYSTSAWSMKTRALGTDELTAIEANGLFTLKDFLPKKPSAEELEVIKEMFKASVDGEAYDANRWGNFYKPSGFNRGAQESDTLATAASAAVRTTKTTTVVDENEVPFTTTSAPASNPAAAMAALRARTLNTAPAEDDTSATGDKPSAEDIIRRIRERQGR